MTSFDKIEHKDNNTCGKKKPFLKKSRALLACKKISRNGPALSTYKCPYCGFWHLTSKREGPQEVTRP